MTGAGLLTSEWQVGIDFAVVKAPQPLFDNRRGLS
jgi:hypothetical protein